MFRCRAAAQALLTILFISGHGDIRMATLALQGGAFDFIEKPFHEQDLLDRVQQVLRVDAARRTLACQQQLLRSRFEPLSQRGHDGQTGRALGRRPHQMLAISYRV